MRITILSAIPILMVFAALLFFLGSSKSDSTPTLKVLTYSAFLNSWGPGPYLAKKFFEQTGVKIEFIDGGDAGLLLKKLTLFSADIILGVDQFAISKSPQNLKWTAIDWSPLTFIYRKSEVDPPKNLNDLLDSRFENKISLSDPRTSTPGLQFVLWIIREKGRDEGFRFLRNLKSNVAFVGPSWSSSYGHFKKKQSQLVFSYITSPVFHWVEEKNLDYQSANLREQLPVQIEFAAVIPESKNTQQAAQFIEFLKTSEIQKLIMEKNFMLPLKSEVRVGTAFERLSLRILSSNELNERSQMNQAEIESILTEWKSIGF